MVRAIVAAVCALASGLALMSSVTPAAAATPAHLTATATPSTVLTHATFYLTGSATPRGAGVITVQQYVGGHWKQISHKSAGPTGSYSIALRAPGVSGTTIYRTTRPGSGTTKTLLSATVHVRATTSAFKVTATTHSPVAADAPVKVAGSVTNHASGFVVLEELHGATWKPVATGRLTSKSTFAFSHVLRAGKHLLRVRKPWTSTVAQGVSKTVTVTVKAPVQPDRNPPTVSIKINGAAPVPSYAGTVSVTVVAAAASGTTIKTISYSLDGGPVLAYTAAISVAATGSHSLTATVTDADQLSSVAHVTWTRQPDTKPPTVTIALNDTDGTSFFGPVTATATATDEGGPAHPALTYKLDSGVFTPYTAPVVVNANGTHTITFKATDNANNVGTASKTWTQSPAGPQLLTVTSDDQAALAQTSPRLVFATFRGDTRVLAAKHFTFTNTSGNAIKVSSIAVGGPDASSFRLAAGQATTLNIAAGGSATVNVEFHPTDPTGCEDAAHPVAIGNVNRNATLTYSSNAAGQPSGSAALSGIYACSAGGNAEPVLDQVLQGLGYTDNVYNGFDRRYIGPSRWIGSDEIISPYFTAADPSQPVSLVPVAHYGSGNASNAYQTTGWYAKGSAMATGSSCSNACNKLWQFPADSLNASNQIVYNQNQKLLPSILPGGSTTFSPPGAFGIFSSDFSEVNFSDDSLNTAHSTANVDVPAASMHYLHQMRIYPARQANGSIIPNTYLIGDDLSRVPSYKNNDYQDVVLLLSNVNPAVGQGPTIGGSTSVDLSAGGSVSGSCSVTGFDGVMANTGGTQCNSGNIAFTGGGLRLTSSAGQLADHNQQNALYKTFDAARGAFTVKARVIGPVNQLTGNYQQIGAFFGPDENNFVKVEAEHNGSGTDPHLTMFFSEKGVAGTVGTVSVPALTSASTLDLIIKGNTNVPDPIARSGTDPYGVHGFPLGELEVFYSINGAAPVQVGTIKEPADVTGWFSRQAKAGILVADPQASPFNATFSSFAITNGW